MKSSRICFLMAAFLLPALVFAGGGPPISSDKEEEAPRDTKESVGSPEREPAGGDGLTTAERIYNEGWALMQEAEWEQAEARFVLALGLDERFPQAHSNLAYVLRMQGEKNFAKALDHYNRALELDPELGIALEYRGELFVQMGEPEKARADLAKLRQLDPALAAEPEAVLEGDGAWPEEYEKATGGPVEG